MARFTSEVSRSFSEFLIIPGRTTRASDISKVSLRSRITDRIEIPLPFLSAAMQSVTGHELAIALAQHGGMGVIPYSLPVEEQAEGVRRVKRFRAGFVYNAMTVSPNDRINKLLEIGKLHGYSTFPVTEEGRLVGLITEKRYHPDKDVHKEVRERMMPAEKLIVGREGITLAEANEMMVGAGIGALPIVDERMNMRSVVFYDDLRKQHFYPDAFIDSDRRLRVAGAVSTHPEDMVRAEQLVKAGADFLCIDASDAHSDYTEEAIEGYKRFRVPIIAGNIVDREAFEFLAKLGVDCVKIGQGSGSTCITRRVKSSGRGQATAVAEIAKARDRFFSRTGKYIPICSDGGITSTGDMAIAFALGADLIMMGKYFAGFTESPTPLTERNFRISSDDSSDLSEVSAYVKPYWGEASPRARNIRRYGHQDPRSFVIEGIEGFVLHKGSVSKHLPNDIHAVKGAIAGAGCRNLQEFYQKVKLEIQTSGSQVEGETHLLK
jgi:IMP dehydrogenase